MLQQFDVIVIGAGVVGLCAAIAMRQRHFSVAILDAGQFCVDTTHQDARVYAINRSSQSLLTELNVWPLLDSTRLSPYRHMHVWDASNQASIDFDARLVATNSLGTIIEESVLKQALLLQAKTVGVEFVPACQVNQVKSDEQGVHITDSGNKHWEARLLIGADGGASITRSLLGVSLTSWSYHQEAIVTLVQTEQPHQQTAWQVFNSKHGGPLAFLPLKDPYLCSIVWATSKGHAKTLLNFSDEEFSETLTHAFTKKLGQCKIIGKRHTFPLQMRHAERYSGINWLLMGDAAHTIHPLAGLGLNLGLADLATWLKLLDKSKSAQWSPKILSAYQRERKHAVWKIIALMEGLKAIFANPLSPIVAIRGLGVQVCNKISSLKRLIIHQAMTL